jgi:hypothetical protein
MERLEEHSLPSAVGPFSGSSWCPRHWQPQHPGNLELHPVWGLDYDTHSRVEDLPHIELEGLHRLERHIYEGLLVPCRLFIPR